MRYDIEETAVYDKYVRWCGRTGPQGPSYPIQQPTRRRLFAAAETLIRLKSGEVTMPDLDRITRNPAVIGGKPACVECASRSG